LVGVVGAGGLQLVEECDAGSSSAARARKYLGVTSQPQKNGMEKRNVANIDDYCENLPTNLPPINPLCKLHANKRDQAMWW
jgi:hypothetical protein